MNLYLLKISLHQFFGIIKNFALQIFGKLASLVVQWNLFRSSPLTSHFPRTSFFKLVPLKFLITIMLKKSHLFHPITFLISHIVHNEIKIMFPVFGTFPFSLLSKVVYIKMVLLGAFSFLCQFPNKG